MEEKIELTYSDLKSMAKNDFIKLFKKAASWKKVSAVLFIAKYQFSNGKMKLVAIPYKKQTEAEKIFKHEVKKDKSYQAKLTCFASLLQTKDEQGNLTFEFTPLYGTLNLDYLQNTASELFSKLKVAVKVTGGDGKMNQNDLLEVVEAADETLSNKKADKIVAKQAQRAAKAAKIQEHISKFELAIGKIEPPKLEEHLAKLQQALDALSLEAQEDGETTNDEQIEISRLETAINEKRQTMAIINKVQSYAIQIQKIINS